MLAPSVSWRGKLLPPKSWRRVCTTAFSTTRLSGLTSPPSTLARGVDSWISSLAASRVNRSRAPESNSETTTSARSRLTCCGSSASVCLPWCSSRMFLPGFYVGTHENSSSDFRIWAIASRNRSFQQLRRSAHRTDASAFSSWPTPEVQTGDYSYSGGDHTKIVMNLEGAAKMWATPAARDWKDSSTVRETDYLALGRQVLQPTGPEYPNPSGPRKLNPAFDEWLMGIPRGWTDSAPVETASFRSWRHTHSALLWRP